MNSSIYLFNNLHFLFSIQFFISIILFFLFSFSYLHFISQNYFLTNYQKELINYFNSFQSFIYYFILINLFFNFYKVLFLAKN